MCRVLRSSRLVSDSGTQLDARVDFAQKTCRSLATTWACLKFMYGGMAVLLLTLAASSYNDLFERDGGGIFDKTETPLLDFFRL